MRALSIRWKLVLPTMSLAALAVMLLVVLLHYRTRDQMLQQLERMLATKSEEVHSVLRSGATTEGLERFLEVETRYLSSPYEYFYEIVDGQGLSLLSSDNLCGRCLGPTDPTRRGEVLTLLHPHLSDELVRARCEAIQAEIPGWQGAHLWVAVSLDPLETAVQASLVQSLLAGFGGLAALFVTLWIVVGRTLRRVASITRRAASITATNLRARLPVNGRSDELDELACVFNEMLSGLERTLEQMEAFTSDAAHQLRTPLTRVRGELDLLLCDRSRLKDPERARLVEMREELERLACTCSRLLLLARLDQGALAEDLQADDVDLGMTVEDFVDQVGPLAAERGVEVRLAGLDAILVRCNRALLLEALFNLLDNALRVSSEGKTIEVALRRVGDDAIITVSDQGPGIPEHLREQVFRRFFRLDAHSGGGGTGLGLAIARGIARVHGGDIHVEASPCGGAALVVSLPLRRKLVGFSSDARSTLNRAG